MTTTTERRPTDSTTRTPGMRTPSKRTPPGGSRPSTAVAPKRRTPALRLRASSRDRWPFVVVVALLAGGGLIALLMLNTGTAQASFTKSRLQTDLSALTQKQQALQQKVSSEEAPEALAQKATALGMAPGPQPGYYVLNADGSYTFVESKGGPTVPTPPAPATADAAPTTPAPEPAAVGDAPAGAAPAADPNAAPSVPTPPAPTG